MKTPIEAVYSKDKIFLNFVDYDGKRIAESDIINAVNYSNTLEIDLFKVVGKINRLMIDNNIKIPPEVSDVSQIFEIDLPKLNEGEYQEVELKITTYSKEGFTLYDDYIDLPEALIKKDK